MAYPVISIMEFGISLFVQCPFVVQILIPTIVTTSFESQRVRIVTCWRLILVTLIIFLKSQLNSDITKVYRQSIMSNTESDATLSVLVCFNIFPLLSFTYGSRISRLGTERALLSITFLFCHKNDCQVSPCTENCFVYTAVSGWRF